MRDEPDHSGEAGASTDGAAPVATVMLGPVPSAPAPELRFKLRRGLRAAVGELWHKRHLVAILAEREYRVRYKQALLGSAWTILTPVFLMLAFTVFLQRVADIDTGSAPYPLFTYLGLIPWMFFSTSLTQGGNSLVLNVSLLNKVYCPREVFPIGSMVVAGFDSVISTSVLVVLFLVYGYPPSAEAYWLPVLLVVQVMFTLGLTLVFSAAIVYIRDVRHGLPLLLQVGLLATPIAYGLDDVPAGLRPIYVVLNPLAAIIDGYRRTILFGMPPRAGLLALAAGSSTVILLVGYAVFKRLESGIADVV